MMRMPQPAWLLPACCQLRSVLWLVCVSITPDSWVVTRQTPDLHTPDLSELHTSKAIVNREMSKFKGLNMQRSCLKHKVPDIGLWMFLWYLTVCLGFLMRFWLMLFGPSLCFTHAVNLHKLDPDVNYTDPYYCYWTLTYSFLWIFMSRYSSLGWSFLRWFSKSLLWSLVQHILPKLKTHSMTPSPMRQPCLKQWEGLVGNCWIMMCVFVKVFVNSYSTPEGNEKQCVKFHPHTGW